MEDYLKILEKQVKHAKFMQRQDDINRKRKSPIDILPSSFLEERQDQENKKRKLRAEIEYGKALDTLWEISQKEQENNEIYKPLELLCKEQLPPIYSENNPIFLEGDLDFDYFSLPIDSDIEELLVQFDKNIDEIPEEFFMDSEEIPFPEDLNEIAGLSQIPESLEFLDQSLFL